MGDLSVWFRGRRHLNQTRALPQLIMSRKPAGGPLLPNPSTGSANPAASLSSLWAYLFPALEHIVRSPTNVPDKAPAIDLEFYAGIHSACYNYFTAQADMYATRKTSAQPELSGMDLYEQLDKFYADTARELILGAPRDDATLVDYIIPCFKRYSAGAQSVNRLLNYVNRHYVKRAIEEDRGWLSINDLLEHVAKTMTPNDTRDKLAAKLQEKKLEEIKRWGYGEGESAEAMAQAEAAAEAASSPDRIVPLVSLAHRRFRTEFFEPLVTAPKLNGGKKTKKKYNNRKATTSPPGPKGRLARSVQELLESNGRETEEKVKLASDLSKILRTVGIRPDHVLIKRLDKFVAANS